ncbi:hypothetical protein D3C72_1386190 [compost metagenome]
MKSLVAQKSFYSKTLAPNRGTSFRILLQVIISSLRCRAAVKRVLMTTNSSASNIKIIKKVKMSRDLST